jgi:hypothetical protein
MKGILAHGGDGVPTRPSTGLFLAGRGYDGGPTDSEGPAAPAPRLITRNSKLASLTKVSYRRNHVSRAGADFDLQSCGMGR